VSYLWRDSFRSLERRFKILTIAALKRLIRPPAIGRAPIWSARAHRILYLRYDRIGDMVLVTGILHAIKLAQPTVSIDVLASVRNAVVLCGNPDVGTVYRVNKARPWSFLLALVRVRRMRYDAVLDAMVTGPSLTSMLIMWASGARHRIGVAGRGNDFALTLPVPRVVGAIHYVDHSAALLSPFGIDPSRSAPQRASNSLRCTSRGERTAGSEQGCGWGIWRPRLFLTATEIREAETFWCSRDTGGENRGARHRRRLVVNVSAGAPSRCWPEDRFVAVIGAVRERFPDVQVLLLGAPADERRKRRIARACGVPAARTARARQMMALVATCDFALTPDTAVTHIASACGKPVVAMFAWNSAPHWSPYGVPMRIVTTSTRTLASLTVAPVLQALEQLLTAEGGRDARQPCPTSPPSCTLRHKAYDLDAFELSPAREEARPSNDRRGALDDSW
jgi:ADP-heptose:LPS heptosyltransferase